MRFIPARAGNTRCVRVRALRRRAHPHSRREYLGSSGLGFGWSGSPPLVRGTCPPAYFWFCVRRLIPARAGNIATTTSTRFAETAHPRSRGEHHVVAFRSQPVCGSSPLARGTLRLESHRVPNLRLIPARAGNISLRGASQTPSSAHPRSRGEHRDVSGYTRIDSGSSPLARGTY